MYILKDITPGSSFNNFPKSGKQFRSLRDIKKYFDDSECVYVVEEMTSDFEPSDYLITVSSGDCKYSGMSFKAIYNVDDFDDDFGEEDYLDFDYDNYDAEHPY
jgi:hypothetical protein